MSNLDYKDVERNFLISAFNKSRIEEMPIPETVKDAAIRVLQADQVANTKSASDVILSYLTFVCNLCDDNERLFKRVNSDYSQLLNLASVALNAAESEGDNSRRTSKAFADLWDTVRSSKARFDAFEKAKMLDTTYFNNVQLEKYKEFLKTLN